MRNLLTHWDAMRILRLALAGVGCCGARGCAIDTRQGKNKEEKEIVYEEVDGAK